MANPLFNMFGNMFQNTPFGNAMQMMQQFNQFRQQFTGDPQKQVQQLMDSGQMNQNQFNQLYQMAQQFRQMMNI